MAMSQGRSAFCQFVELAKHIVLNRDIVCIIRKDGGKVLYLDPLQRIKGYLHLVDVSCPPLTHLCGVNFALEIVSVP